MTEDTCKEHTGCIERIGALENNHRDMRKRVDSIINRVNIAIGALVLNLAMMVVNLLQNGVR